MAVDLTQFLPTFFEECFESLDEMEQALLNLDMSSNDAERINSIFRGAHSIKGASATFGMTDVANFTHVMETLFDEMRAGRRQITQDDIDLLLSSIDELRKMLSALKADAPIDAERVAASQKRLEEALASQPNLGTSATTGGTESRKGSDESSAEEREFLRDDVNGVGSVLGDVNAAVEGNRRWRIFFKPHAHLLRNGNCALRIFNELAALGDLKAESDCSALPSVAEFEPESSYLSWTLELETAAQRAAVEEVFAWVEGECELDISLLSAPAPAKAQAPSPNQSQADISTQPNGTNASPITKSNGAAKNGAEVASIRVAIEKIDALMDIVGELIITQSMLTQLSQQDNSNHVQFEEGLAQLERTTRTLQESVMRVRMLPISFAFNRFPRLVRDLSHQLGKKVELTMSGEQTELDKTVMEKIGDPLVHLVRNALDHGIESPAVRRAAEKPEVGSLHLNAYHRSGNIVIEISDDGAGLNRAKILAKAKQQGLLQDDEELSDEKIYELILQPGFSTAEVITNISGRGVGMDVVSRNIRSLGGGVDIRTEEGKGSTIIVRLPLTLAIIDGQSVRVGVDTYILPLVSIIESIQVKADLVSYVTGKGETLSWRGEYIPILRLHKVFGVTADVTDISAGLLVVVEGEGKRAAIFVDELLAQQQVVVKTIETNFVKVEGVSGATILGDGTVALILDVSGLIGLGRKSPGAGIRPPTNETQTLPYNGERL